MYSKMSSDDNEEGLCTALPRPPRSRQILGNLIGRRKSTGQELLNSRRLPSGSPTFADPESQATRVTRSQSNANVHTFKAQWADALISQYVETDVYITLDLGLTMPLESPCKPP